MNTFEVGEKFEVKSLEIINIAIKNGELGILPNTAKVFRKKGYYSKDREDWIIFDLSIEIWPPNAERYSLLYLVECKSSSTRKIPVDDVEEFCDKINQVSQHNSKGIFITDSSLQTGAYNIAKNRGLMLIEASESEYSVILHRERRQPNNSFQLNIEQKLLTLISKKLGPQKVIGLKKLSSHQIEDIAKSILIDFNKLRAPIDILEFSEYLESHQNLTFDFTKNLSQTNGKKIDGYYDIKNHQIFIDRSLYGHPKFAFILGHEIGHSVLHNELRINKELYHNFEDSEFDPFINRYKLQNDRHWIEWQANKFSMSLILPKKIFLKELYNFRKDMGEHRAYNIYLDDQPINKQDYFETVKHLSKYFGTSNISIRFRLQDLRLITYGKKDDDFRNALRNYFAIED